MLRCRIYFICLLHVSSFDMDLARNLAGFFFAQTPCAGPAGAARLSQGLDFPYNFPCADLIGPVKPSLRAPGYPE
jgi:hypothetical protein